MNLNIRWAEVADVDVLAHNVVQMVRVVGKIDIPPE